MLSRRLIASFAAVFMLPQAAAEQCPWPPPDAAPEAVRPAPDDVEPVDSKDLPVQVTSGGAELTREGDARLTDGVVIRQGRREMSAESASYDASERRFTVEGDVEYRSPDLRVKGGSGSWDSDGTGEFIGAEFEMPSRPARGSAASIDMTRAGELQLRKVSFTTCPAGNSDWFLHASEIDIDQKRQQGKGRNVRIELKGVPILYAPVITFPVGNARKSGFLFPSFGNTDKSGFELGIPYYRNLAPNYDTTLTPFFLSRRGAGINSEFRYLTGRSEGRLETRFLPDDDLEGSDRRLSELWNRTHFGERLRIDASLADASDGQYFEDFSRGPDGTSVTYLDRYVHLAWLGGGWRLDGRLQDFQTIDQTIDRASRPYSRLPQLFFTGLWTAAGDSFAASLDAETTWFDRDVGVTGLRMDLTPRLALALRRPGYYIEPSAAWNFTAYQLSDLPSGADDSLDREAPILSLDAGLVFEREAGSRNQLVQTLEPRLRYTWIPFRDQDELPVFDTALPDLNLVQLFRTNRYVGADRLGDANELAAGVTTRLTSAESGRQYLTATIGQRFYFESPEVTLPGELPETRNTSNLIGEIEMTAWRDWSARIAMEYDRSESNTLLGQARVQYQPRPDTVVNLGYRYREALLEQWDASVAWRLSRSWQVFARQVYSTKESESIDRFAGFEYSGCCWGIRLIGRRYVSNRTGESDNSILLQVELKGLSSVGSRNDTFLRQGIRGYSPGSAVPTP